MKLIKNTFWRYGSINQAEKINRHKWILIPVAVTVILFLLFFYCPNFWLSLISGLLAPTSLACVIGFLVNAKEEEEIRAVVGDEAYLEREAQIKEEREKFKLF